MNTGTIELLSTKPVSDWDILLGKYFAALTLVLVALAPTLVYWYTVYNLACRLAMDMGGTAGSILDLFFSLYFAPLVCFVHRSIESNCFVCGRCVSFIFSCIWPLRTFLAWNSFYKNDYLVESLGLNTLLLDESWCCGFARCGIFLVWFVVYCSH